MADMTEAQAAWLRKLRAEGPIPVAPRGGLINHSKRLGYSKWSTSGWKITPSGLAALAAHEAKNGEGR